MLSPSVGIASHSPLAFSAAASWAGQGGRLRPSETLPVSIGKPFPQLTRTRRKRSLALAPYAAATPNEPPQSRYRVRGAFRNLMEAIRIQLVLGVDQLLDKGIGAKEYNANHKYLQGNWEPVSVEHRALKATVVEGELPADLSGVFLRIGPNPPVHPTKRHHLFDGEGMIHSVRIEGGSALYSNKWVETERMRFERELGQDFFVRVGEYYSPWGLLKLLTTIPQRIYGGPIQKSLEASPVNTAMVLTPAGKFFAMNEGGSPLELELGRDGAVDRLVGFDNKLAFAHSAHPKVDRKTGETFVHGYSLNSPEAFFKVGRMAADGSVLSWFKVDVGGAGFYHDIALTSNYVLVFDGAARFTPEKMVEGKPIFSWDGEYETRIGIVPRNATEGSEVKWFSSPSPFYVVHPLHAWEEEEEIVVWAPMGVGLREGKEPDPDQVIYGADDRMRMSEVRINTKTGHVSLLEIDDSFHSEYSHVRSDLVATADVQFGYAAIMQDQDFDVRGISKWDLKGKKLDSVVYFPPHMVGEEPVFVPYGGPGSDDGFIATICIHDTERWAELVLYDAKTMDPTPVARIRLPQRVPHGFHGHWLSGSELEFHLEACEARRRHAHASRAC